MLQCSQGGGASARQHDASALRMCGCLCAHTEMRKARAYARGRAPHVAGARRHGWRPEAGPQQRARAVKSAGHLLGRRGGRMSKRSIGSLGTSLSPHNPPATREASRSGVCCSRRKVLSLLASPGHGRLGARFDEAPRLLSDAGALSGAVSDIGCPQRLGAETANRR